MFPAAVAKQLTKLKICAMEESAPKRDDYIFLIKFQLNPLDVYIFVVGHLGSIDKIYYENCSQCHQ